MAFPTDWGRRCALVIQSGQVTDNEVNFPLLVTEDTLPSEIFDADGSYPALNGGGDIRFSSDEAGNTQLACEIEKFVTDNDPANGKAAIWVKVPSLSSSSNTTIYIWYNKAGESQPAEDNAYGKENVWDSGFVMVQHMNQIPDGTAGEIVDSTSNNNDGTTSGMDSADQVAGQIDGSLDFDGVNDYVEAVLSDTLTPPLSITLWIKAGAHMSTLIQDDSIANGLLYSRNSVELALYTNAGEKSYAYVLDDTFSQVVLTQLAEAKPLIYVNSQLLSAGVLDGTPSPSFSHIRIGGTWNHFDGIIDEVRISNVARTAGWTATEYNNQNAPGTFLIEGTPETPGAAPITFIPQIIMF